MVVVVVVVMVIADCIWCRSVSYEFVPSVAVDLDNASRRVRVALVATGTVVDGHADERRCDRLAVVVVVVGGEERAGRTLAARVAASGVARRRHRDAVDVGTGAWTRRNALRVPHRRRRTAAHYTSSATSLHGRWRIHGVRPYTSSLCTRPTSIIRMTHADRSRGVRVLTGVCLSVLVHYI